MRDGTRRDGSFVAGTPVVIPEALVQEYPIFEAHLRANDKLMSELESDGVKEFKRRYGISKGGLCIEDWKPSGNYEIVTNDNWGFYASHELFPYLKAAANGGHFVLRNENECTIVRPLSPFPDLYARLARLKTIEHYCVPTEHGVLVAAPWRLLISLLWFLFSLSVGVAAAVHKQNDWFESMESFFTATTIVAITLPAIVSLLVQEPELVRNAIRGKKTLTSDQQVATWFNLRERDYAAAAISLKGTFLVSEARGCYLSGESNSALSGNGYLVSAGVLQHVGILVGRAVYRRLWEAQNRVVEEVDTDVSHLTALERQRIPPCWASSRVDDRLVG
ncbi:hypothetical protein FGB62_257g014 [Gracilaria domingensis]|nr:hypothetical protein FGB62_257g014 [Gracilaria domingensis]